MIDDATTTPQTQTELRQTQPFAKHAGAPDEPIRIAVVGDIHVHRDPPHWKHLIGKRYFAHRNAKENEHRRFDDHLLVDVGAQITGANADAILLTGDFSVSALASEFRQALLRLTTSMPIGVHMLGVPGNHDRYTFSSAREHRCEKEMSARKSGAAFMVPDKSPYHHPITKRWWLVAIDSVVPCLLTSRGRVGSEALRQLNEWKNNISEDTGVIVLCHYPFDVPPGVKWKWHHRLAGAGKLRQWVASLAPRRVIFLHGHIHRPWLWSPADDDFQHVTMLNAGPPTQRTAEHPNGRGFWTIDLPVDPKTEVVFKHHEPDANMKWHEEVNGPRLP